MDHQVVLFIKRRFALEILVTEWGLYVWFSPVRVNSRPNENEIVLLISGYFNTRKFSNNWISIVSYFAKDFFVKALIKGSIRNQYILEWTE